MAIARQHIAGWLCGVAAMVWAMALIGAVTRLTGSGLSIAEWRPVIGVSPPLSDAEWDRLFALYRQTAEFRVFNNGMDISGFKTIFFWEWLHRLWGHLVALSFALPFLWFLRAGVLPARLAWRLGGLLLLGALQGGVGWFMVLSGLADRPEVSHYRLALHLGLAALIFALLLATARRLPGGDGPAASDGLRAHGGLALGLVGLTMLWGALVAGLDAGLAYNTFPQMAGQWIPAEIANLSPWWLNGLENTAGVQFIHRLLALTTLAVLLGLSLRARRIAPRLAVALAAAALFQVGLGVATLLSVVWTPLAAAHQGGAFIVLGLLVWLTASFRSQNEAFSHGDGR